jgi:adenylate cyclase
VATEIERKFLVSSSGWRDGARASIPMVQGYLAQTGVCSVRVRIGGDRAWLNFKGLTIGARRTEFEYAIPIEDARQMLDLYCDRPLIEKTRHYVRYGDHDWEIDEFEGANAGLIVAEVELAKEDETFATPDWVGREVTHDPRYYNMCLVEHPWSEWDHE